MLTDHGNSHEALLHETESPLVVDPHTAAMTRLLLIGACRCADADTSTLPLARQGFGSSARSDQTHISAGRSAAVQRRQSDHSAAVSLHHLQWYRDGCAGIEPAEPYPRRWHWRCQEGTLALPAVQRSLAALAAAQPVLRS